MPDDQSPQTSGNTGESKGYHHPGSENLIPWKPGQSGNPSGRPKKKPITEAYEALLNDPQAAKEIALAMFDVIKARGKGTAQAAKELADRVEGKVTDTIEVSGQIGTVVTSIPRPERE